MRLPLNLQQKILLLVAGSMSLIPHGRTLPDRICALTEIHVGTILRARQQLLTCLSGHPPSQSGSENLHNLGDGDKFHRPISVTINVST